MKFKAFLLALLITITTAFGGCDDDEMCGF